MDSSQAEKACRACQANKRPCDKLLPGCGLCHHVGRVCDYDDGPETPPSLSDFTAMQARINGLESRLISQYSDADTEFDMWSPIPSVNTNTNSVAITNPTPVSSTFCARINVPTPSNRFPSSLFLDIDCFKLVSHELPLPHITAPNGVLALLTQESMVVNTCDQFFNTINQWMPFISKKTLDLRIPPEQRDSDQAMLFLAMRLSVCNVEEVQNGSLYRLAKLFLSTLETGGLMSLHGLQASILVALYEYSHAIYPAAWMSVGSCARYVQLLGLSCSAGNSNFLRDPTTWIEVEERRRTWWAAFILDRLVATGNKRPCALMLPSIEDRLPVDDHAWNTGEMASSVYHHISTDYRIHQSGFARVCQAALYLDHALELARNQALMENDGLRRTRALTDELISFCTILESQATPSPEPNSYIAILASECIARSALFIGLDLLTYPEKMDPSLGHGLDGESKDLEEVMMQEYAKKVIRSISSQITDLAWDLGTQLEMHEEKLDYLSCVSPFIMDSIYCATVAFYWLAGESGEVALRYKVVCLETCLEALGLRWGLGQEYKKLIEAYKVV